MPQYARFARDMNRRLFCCLLTLVLVSPSTLAQAQEPAGSAAPQTVTAPSAKDLYAQRRYVEAARAFEAMDTPGALYNAGMARAAAGHHAHALLRWGSYQELMSNDLTALGRADIVRLMGEARQRTVAVHFAATVAPEARTLIVQPQNSLVVDALRIPWPAGQTELTVQLDAGAWSAALGAAGVQSLVVPPGKPTLNITLTTTPPTSRLRLRLGPTRALKRGIDVAWAGPGKAEGRRFVGADTRWELSPGTWRLGVQARGYESFERAVTVTEGPTDIDVTLRRNRHERARIGLGVSLGIAGVGLMVSGGALLAIGRRYNEGAAITLNGVPNPLTEKVMDAVERDLRRQSGGVALLSAGGGATVVALTAGLGGGKRALAAEAGVGAAFLAGGIAWLAYAQGCPSRLHRQQSRPFDYFAPTYQALRNCAGPGVPGAVLLGAGAGLLGGAVVALATRRALGRRASRLRAAASLSTTDWAVSIQGRF